MQPNYAYYRPPISRSTDVLTEMYHSPELHNEGLLSFEYPLYRASDEELDYFLGGLIHSASKAVGGVAKTVGSVAKQAGKVISSVEKVVPSQLLTAGLAWTPMGMAVRAGMGAMKAAANGTNVFQSAMRSLAADPVSRFYIDTGMAAARGENILKAAQKAAQAGIGDLRQSLQFAAMVAPFIPGVGTGVAAALGAANALAAGRPITDALISAVRSAIPGGAVAQMAFDTAVNLARGKKLSESLLDSARTQLPGGPAAQAAFDAALALAKGRNIQDAAFAATGRLLPPSPYTADALAFAKKVAAGENIQRAALSAAGNAVLSRIERQTGPLVSNIRSQVPALVRSPSIVRFPIRHEFLQEVGPNPSRVLRYVQLVRSGQASIAIAESVKNGQSDVNELTNMVFYARHPELGGRPLRSDERALAQEWIQIRNTVVTPTLARLRADKSFSAPASSSVAPVAAPVPVTNAPLFLGLDTFGLDGNKIRDWSKAKAEVPISFAFFRANYGAFKDTMFVREWPKIKDAGIVRGAYLFLRFPSPDVDRKYGPCPSAEKQAQAFIDTVGKPEQGDLPPSLDVEFPGGRSATGMSAQQCLERVRIAWKLLRNYYRTAPIIYTSERVWREDLNNLPAPDLVESPLWLASYPFKKGLAVRGLTVTRFSPKVPPPWGDRTNWWIHQYQGDALRLPGFATGNVDMNRFNPMARGATGDRVKWTQRRLAIPQTGTFDAAMETALRQFRRKHGLPDDVIIDPRTFAFLCWSNP